MNEKKKQRVVLKDIANIAGISINAVSCALRGGKNISKETIDKVQKIADELGYVPDIHAQSLRTGSCNVIAIVYDNVSNPYYSIMMELIISELEKKGYESMIFVDHHALGHLSEILAKRILSYRVSGVLTFLAPTNEACKIFKNNQIPIVLIGRNGKELKCSSVFSNDYQGGILAAEQLYKSGGKGFCYFTEHAELKINEQRCNGFIQGLKNEGIELPKENIVVGSINNDGFKDLKSLLNEKKIDSIFCFSDLIAFKVVSFLMELGYSIPKDISVIGYDNLQDQLPYPIRLSSIDGGKKESVTTALGILFNSIEKGYKERSVYKEIDVFFQKGTTTK